MPSVRQPLTVGIPTSEFYLYIVTKVLGKDSRILLPSEYLNNGGNEWGDRFQADKQFYEVIFCRNGIASEQ